MARNVLNPSLLDHLSVESFISYLLSKGWRQVEYENPRLMVFALDDPGNPPYVVALPVNSQASDYAISMAEAVQRLADVEETTPQEIEQKVQARDQDRLSLRLLLPSDEFPSLEITSPLFHGLRDLVAYGACMEQDKRRHFKKPFRVAKEQAHHFRFTHTFEGSFGLTIASHINEPEQLSIWDTPPLQRKVLERITRGFLFTQRALQRQDALEISQHFEQGFNANMCNAVKEMLKGLQDVQVLYSVAWSPRLSATSDVAHLSPILLQKETPQYLEEAAHHLERDADKDLDEERMLEGKIINLGIGKHAEKIVTISAEEWGKVDFILQPAEYAIACDVHSKDLPVTVRGKLTKQGKRKPWRLLDPHHFQLA